MLKYFLVKDVDTLKTMLKTYEHRYKFDNFGDVVDVVIQLQKVDSEFADAFDLTGGLIVSLDPKTKELSFETDGAGSDQYFLIRQHNGKLYAKEKSWSKTFAKAV